MFRRIFISEKGFTVFSLILALSLIVGGTIMSHRHFDSIGVPFNPEVVTQNANNTQSETSVIVPAEDTSSFNSEANEATGAVDNASVETLVEKLKESNVAFTEGNQLTSSDTVMGSVIGTTVYVASISKDDLKGANPEDFSNAILEQLPKVQNYNLVILTVKDGDTLSYHPSSPRPNIPVRALQLLGEPTTDLSGDVIAENMPNFRIIVDPSIYVDQPAPKKQEAPKAPAKPINWGIALTYVLSALSTALVFGGFITSRAYASELTSRIQKGEVAPSIQNRKKLSKKLATSIDNVTELSNNELKSYPAMNSKVIKTISLFNELIDAMEFAHVDDHKRRLVYIEYENIMKKLEIILGGKYYLDLKKNSHHWDNVQEKIDAVETTVDTVQEQIITTIKQIKSGTEIHIQSSIDSILGFKVDSYSDMLKPKEKSIDKKKTRGRF